MKVTTPTTPSQEDEDESGVQRKNSEMITDILQRKIDRSIKLLQSVAPTDGSAIEIAYSGGKDSDVILQLAKEAGINYRAIYKNTTIDPPGTIAHAKEMGAEVLQPKNGMTFFKLVEKNGLPNRFYRHCCKYLKEYKVLDKAVIGVRRSESTKRANRYTEPTQCRFFGSKKEHVEQIMPILEWTDEDVANYLQDRNVKCAPVYYDEQGTFHVERRLGCWACPLASINKRLEQLKQRPKFVVLYAKALQKWWDTHPNTKSKKNFETIYDQLVRDIFFDNSAKFEQWRNGLFGKTDCKSFLEEYFGITFNE